MTENLPPLPEARIESYQTDATMRVMTLHTYNESDMRAYAQAAIALYAAQPPQDEPCEARDSACSLGTAGCVVVHEEPELEACISSPVADRSAEAPKWLTTQQMIDAAASIGFTMDAAEAHALCNALVLQQAEQGSKQ